MPMTSVEMTCAECQEYSPPAQVKARTSNADPDSARKAPKKSIAASFLVSLALSKFSRSSTHCFQSPVTFLRGMKKKTQAVVITLKKRFSRKIHLLDTFSTSFANKLYGREVTMSRHLVMLALRQRLVQCRVQERPPSPTYC
jgi:hypothetical protein